MVITLREVAYTLHHWMAMANIIEPVELTVSFGSRRDMAVAIQQLKSETSPLHGDIDVSNLFSSFTLNGIKFNFVHREKVWDRRWAE